MENISSFKEFLQQKLKDKKFSDSPEGDFAHDVMSDKKFREFKKWDDLHTYIVFRGADSVVVKAAKKCFVAWEAERAQN